MSGPRKKFYVENDPTSTRTKKIADPCNNEFGYYSYWTDYWVSQGRKFCEFCKCSIADNKPSIQFHENGKKHKENVAKRLTEMQKKAAKEAKDAVNLDKEMKNMEAAALKAYLNDVKSNLDYTSQLIRSGATTLPTAQCSSSESAVKVPSKKSEKKAGRIKNWREAKSEDGQIYYWNSSTGGPLVPFVKFQPPEIGNEKSNSIWEKPLEGYVSLVDQEKRAKQSVTKKDGGVKKKLKKSCKPVHLKDKIKSKEIKQESSNNLNPIPQSHPYGKWQKIEVKKEEPVDLQLPQQEFIQISIPKLREDSERKFKEKTSTAGSIISTYGETSFKKRKLVSEGRKNIRQRIVDD